MFVFFFCRANVPDIGHRTNRRRATARRKKIDMAQLLFSTGAINSITNNSNRRQSWAEVAGFMSLRYDTINCKRMNGAIIEATRRYERRRVGRAWRRWLLLLMVDRRSTYLAWNNDGGEKQRPPKGKGGNATAAPPTVL